MKKAIIFTIGICCALCASSQIRITDNYEDLGKYMQEVSAMKASKNERNAVKHFQDAYWVAQRYFGRSLDTSENDTQLMFELFDAVQWTTDYKYKNTIKDLDPSKHSYPVWEQGTRVYMEFIVEWLARVALKNNDQMIWIKLFERPTVGAYSPIAEELADHEFKGK